MVGRVHPGSGLYRPGTGHTPLGYGAFAKSEGATVGSAVRNDLWEVSMKHVSRSALIVILAMTGCLLCLAAPAFATVIVVHPGESIQAAINNAHQGDTIVV